MEHKDSRRPGIISRMLRFISKLTHREQRELTPFDVNVELLRDPQASSRISKRFRGQNLLTGEIVEREDGTLFVQIVEHDAAQTHNAQTRQP